jgi:hypothetical protein
LKNYDKNGSTFRTMRTTNNLICRMTFEKKIPTKLCDMDRYITRPETSPDWRLSPQFTSPCKEFSALFCPVVHQGKLRVAEVFLSSAWLIEHEMSIASQEHEILVQCMAYISGNRQTYIYSQQQRHSTHLRGEAINNIQTRYCYSC